MSIKYANWNHLYTLIAVLGPDAFHNWEEISANPNITPEIVEAHPDWPWDYYLGLSANPNITWDFVLAHREEHWDYNCLLSKNPNITWDMLTEFEISERLTFICNPNMTPDIYKLYLKPYRNVYSKLDLVYKHDRVHIPCKYVMLYRDPNIDFAELRRRMDKFYNKVHKFVRSSGNIIIRVHNKYPEFFKLVDICNNMEICVSYIAKLLEYRGQYELYDNMINPHVKIAGAYLTFNELVKTVYDFRKCASYNKHIKYNEIKHELYKWDVNNLIVNNALNIMEIINLTKYKVDHAKSLKSNYYYTNELVKLTDLSSKMKQIIPRYTQYRSQVTDVFTAIMQCDINLTWRDVYDGLKNNEIPPDLISLIANNQFFKHPCRAVIMARKYYDLWRTRIADRHAAQRRINRAIYDCCIHELHMRWRDAGR